MRLKHILFKIKISDEHKFETDSKANEIINDFLNDSNHVYVNHSLTILSTAIRETGAFKNVNQFLIISLVYKDLAESSLDLKKTSKKTIAAVKKAVEENTKIEPPKFKTNFEKTIDISTQSK